MRRVFIAYYLHKDSVAIVRQRSVQCLCGSAQASMYVICYVDAVDFMAFNLHIYCVQVCNPMIFLIKSNCLSTVGIITNRRCQLFIKAGVCVPCNGRPCVCL